jgi:hypothetical protein
MRDRQYILIYDKNVSYLVDVGVGFPHSAGHGTAEVLVDLAVDRLKKEKINFFSKAIWSESMGDMFLNAHAQQMFATRPFVACVMTFSFGKRLHNAHLSASFH